MSGAIGALLIGLGACVIIAGAGFVASQRPAANERDLAQKSELQRLAHSEDYLLKRVSELEKEVQTLLETPPVTPEEYAKLWEVRVVTYENGVAQAPESVRIPTSHWLYRSLAIHGDYPRAIFRTEEEARIAGVNVLGLYFAGLYNGSEGLALDPRAEIVIGPAVAEPTP